MFPRSSCFKLVANGKCYLHWKLLHKSSIKLRKIRKIFAKFSAVESERIVYTAVHVSLEKEIENLCAVFTYSIKQAREIRNFHAAVVQRRLSNVQESVMHVQSFVLLI